MWKAIAASRLAAAFLAGLSSVSERVDCSLIQKASSFWSAETCYRSMAIGSKSSIP